MLDDIFEENDDILYEVEIIDHKLDYVKDTNGDRIEICKLNEVEHEEKSVFDLCSFMGKGKTPIYVEASNVQVIKSGQSKGIYNFDLKDKYYTSNESISLDDERILLTGDLVINTTGTGTAGRVTAYIQEDRQLKTPDSHMCIMRPKDSIFYKYFLQLFLNIGFSNLENMASGIGGLIELGMPIIKNIKVNIPLSDSKEKSLQLQMSITKYIEDKMIMVDNRDNTVDIMLSLLKLEKEKIVDDIFTGGQRQIDVGGFLIRNKTGILLEDDSLYKRITIRMNNQGITLRDEEFGRNIGTKKQFLVKDGQFLLSKIDARNGAFGIVNEDLNDAIITGNFWAYDINEQSMLIDFFLLFATSNRFISFCEKASEGITGRHYLDETKFLNAKIPFYSIKEQEDIMQDIKKIFSEINKRKDSLLIMKELLEIGRTKILNGVLNGN